MSRNPFTAKEDDFLATYIAKYNPQPHGRLGNNLYKSLEENPKKWPWSKTHSWQSWRERYKKNQDVIDRKILRIQKDKGKKKEDEESDVGEASEPDEREAHKVRQQKNTVASSSKPTKNLGNISNSNNILIPPRPAVDEPSKRIGPDENAGATASKASQSCTAKASEQIVDNDIPKQRTVKQSSDSYNDPVSARTTAHEVAPVIKSEPPRSYSQPIINSLLEVVDLTKEEMTDGDLMHELFGSEGEESEVDELHSTHSTHSPSPSRKPPTSNVTKSTTKEDAQEPEIPVGNPSQEPTPPISGAEAPLIRTSRTPLKKPRPRPKPRNIRNEDPFETPSPSPPAKTHTTSPVATKSALPVLVDNGFRNVLKRPRPSTENEEGPLWPPKRAKRKAVNAADPARDESQEQMDVDEPELAKVMKEAKEPVQPQSAEVNTVASSSTTKHQPPAVIDVPKVVNQPPSVQSRPVPINNVMKPSDSKLQPLAEPALPKGVTEPVQPPLVQVNVVENSSPSIPQPPAVPVTLKQVKKPVQPRPVQLNAVASSSTSKLKPSSAHGEPLAPPKLTSPEAHILPKRKVFKSSINPGNAISWASSTFTLPEVALSDNDPFMAYVVPEKAKANPLAEGSRPPRIDLHKRSLQRRLTNNLGSISAHRSSRHTSRASSVTSTRTKGSAADALRKSLVTADLPISSVNFAVAAAREIAQIVIKMGSACGVKDEVALKTYENTQSLEKTKFLLEKYKQAMAEMEKKLYSADPALRHFFDAREESQVGDEEDSDDEIPEGLVVRESDTTVVQECSIRKSHSKTSSRRSRTSGRPSLNIRPLPIEDERDIDDDYTPPHRSRAGQFARLMKQGRTEEAVEREKRHVSGVHFSLTQTQDQGMLMGQSSASRPASEAPVSPSPRSRLRKVSMKVDAGDVDVGTDVVEDETRDVNVAENGGRDIDVVDDGELAPDVDFGVAEDSDYDDDVEGGEHEVDVVESDEGDVAVAESSEDNEQSDMDEDDPAGEQEDVHQQENVEESVFDHIPAAQQIKEDDDDDDDIYVKDETFNHEADDESDEAEENEGNPGSSPLYPSTRTLIKRLSGGRENEPEFKAETEEHRQLALGVSEENKEELQEFEENHNPDLLRLWSLKWMREIMAIKPPMRQDERGTNNPPV